MTKLRSIQEQGARIMAVRAMIEQTKQATREQQEFLLSCRPDSDDYIEDLLNWLVIDAGVKIGQIICAIKCVGGQSGTPRLSALRLARQSSTREAVVMA